MWQVELYTTSSGKSPVREFIKQLSPIPRGRAFNALKLLRQFGPHLRQPYSKKLVGPKKLFELRTIGRSPVRLFYTSRPQGFFVLRAFIKKTNKTPLKEIKIALSRL